MSETRQMDRYPLNLSCLGINSVSRAVFTLRSSNFGDKLFLERQTNITDGEGALWSWSGLVKNPGVSQSLDLHHVGLTFLTCSQTQQISGLLIRHAQAYMTHCDPKGHTISLHCASPGRAIIFRGETQNYRSV